MRSASARADEGGVGLGYFEYLSDLPNFDRLQLWFDLSKVLALFRRAQP